MLLIRNINPPKKKNKKTPFQRVFEIYSSLFPYFKNYIFNINISDTIDK